MAVEAGISRKLSFRLFYLTKKIRDAKIVFKMNVLNLTNLIISIILEVVIAILGLIVITSLAGLKHKA